MNKTRPNPASPGTPHRLLLRLGALLVLFALAAACGSSDEGDDSAPASSEESATETTADDTADDTVEEPVADSTSDDDEVPTGSGPDGLYLVGDTFTDGDFLFVYEGLVKVPLDPQGNYTEGECYFAIGTATFIEGPSSQISNSDAFRPAFDPIIAGTVDDADTNDFFDCDASAIGALGYSQSTTTDITLGESALVWLDAIYLTPEQSGQLDGFQLYRMDDLRFDAEVTNDVSS